MPFWSTAYGVTQSAVQRISKTVTTTFMLLGVVPKRLNFRRLPLAQKNRSLSFYRRNTLMNPNPGSIFT